MTACLPKEVVDGIALSMEKAGLPRMATQENEAGKVPILHQYLHTPSEITILSPQNKDTNCTYQLESYPSKWLHVPQLKPTCPRTIMREQTTRQSLHFLTSLPISPVHKDKLYAPYALNWITQHDYATTRVADNARRANRLPGGNYVDVALRVVVQGATDTLMVNHVLFMSRRHSEHFV